MAAYEGSVQDKKPYIEVKKARLARAGVYEYFPIEIAALNMTPAKIKDKYTMYRPPDVLLRNLDKFNMIPLTDEHPPHDVAADNWKAYTVGFVGSSAGVEVLDTGEIFIVNDVVFYDKDAYEAYRSGKVEVSLGYDAKNAVVMDPDKTGYDFVLSDISTVNHLALCDKGRGRAGPNGRVLDSINAVEIAHKLNGGGEMGAITSVLAAFGIGKVKDSAFSLSGTVMDSLTRVAAMDAAALDKNLAGEVTAVMQHLTPLGACEAKGTLVATVADSYKHAKDVLEKKGEVGKVLDALYSQCVEADKVTAQAVLDSIVGKKEGDGDGDEKKGDGKKKGGDGKEAAAVKDSAQIIDDAVKNALSSVTDSIIADLSKKLPGMVDQTVKTALGQEPGAAANVTDSRTLDSLTDFAADSSFLLKGLFPSAR